MHAEEAQGVADWMGGVRSEVDHHIREALLSAEDEASDPTWGRCRELLSEYSLRPAKRVRAALLFSAFALTDGRAGVAPGLCRFAAGVELLHTFMLVHDDVADHATLRRNGPALHLLMGQDRAVVVGDYLFARAMEVMLSAPLAQATEVTRYYLQVCRQTAAGQYLDLHLGKVPLSQVSLFQTMKVAQLKTARYGFVAPLVAGARLAGATAPELQAFERVGRLIGLSYQFVDDLLGMFGDSALSGKSTDSDFLEGKRTFPVIAAYVRADAQQKLSMERMWSEPHLSELAAARNLLVETGGKAATERVIRSTHKAARTLIEKLPHVGGHREFLLQLLHELSVRCA